MDPDAIRTDRSPEITTPRPASGAQGAAQRTQLRRQLGAVRWWTSMSAVASAGLFTVLAARQTQASSNAALALASTAATQYQQPINGSGSSLFQGQGDAGSTGGSFLAPVASSSVTSRSVRTSSS